MDAIYGAVTTGEIWKFLKLVHTTVSIDLTDYYISPNLNKILGILMHGLGLPVPTSRRHGSCQLFLLTSLCFVSTNPTANRCILVVLENIGLMLRVESMGFCTLAVMNAVPVVY